jgi:hypothetical protein
MILDEAKGVATEYLTAVRDGQYDKAYDLLCQSEQQHTTAEEFADSFRTVPALTSFEVGEPVARDQIVVPATLHYRGGSEREVRLKLEQDDETASFKVCGTED